MFKKLNSDRIVNAKRRNKREEANLVTEKAHFDRQSLQKEIETRIEKQKICKSLIDVKACSGRSEVAVPPKDRSDREFLRSPYFVTGSNFNEKHMTKWKDTERHLQRFILHPKNSKLKHPRKTVVANWQPLQQNWQKVDVFESIRKDLDNDSLERNIKDNNDLVDTWQRTFLQKYVETVVLPRPLGKEQKCAATQEKSEHWTSNGRMARPPSDDTTSTTASGLCGKQRPHTAAGRSIATTSTTTKVQRRRAQSAKACQRYSVSSDDGTTGRKDAFQNHRFSNKPTACDKSVKQTHCIRSNTKGARSGTYCDTCGWKGNTNDNDEEFSIDNVKCGRNHIKHESAAFVGCKLTNKRQVFKAAFTENSISPCQDKKKDQKVPVKATNTDRLSPCIARQTIKQDVQRQGISKDSFSSTISSSRERMSRTMGEENKMKILPRRRSRWERDLMFEAPMILTDAKHDVKRGNFMSSSARKRELQQLVLKNSQIVNIPATDNNEKLQIKIKAFLKVIELQIAKNDTKQEPWRY